MDKYLIILPDKDKEIMIQAEEVDAELTDGRTFFYVGDGFDKTIVAVAPVTAMIIKINKP